MIININAVENPYLPLFNKQKGYQFSVGNTSYRERIKKLSALKHAVEFTYREEIKKALYEDFRKPYLETDLTEIYPVIGEIKYVKRHLKKWMKNERVKTPLSLWGTTSWVRHEPKGVCLIISPWNFPVNLTFGPLVSAIAAGNTVILKPSEMTPHASRVMAKIINEIFDEKEVALVEGETQASKDLLKLPFNHIFFTGSPFVGKIVMEAASKHLTSVTLELGGKSPTIVDETANLKTAAKRIAWAKFLNNGQICVSPDYVLIQESVKEAFLEALASQITDMYSKDIKSSPDYSRTVNEKHFLRLTGLIEEAITNGSNIHIGGDYQLEERFIEPTVISNLLDSSGLMKEEIFGPILPIKTFKELDEAINYVNSREKPLALYIYTSKKRNSKKIIKNTRAGSTAINTSVLQYANHHLPFGGINNSGIGKSHGYYGFEAFSNKRSVMKQYLGGALSLLFPPYSNIKQRLMEWTIKWF
nr:aldehyde dehydrogenase family protein [Mangrovimonas sp. CR14]